MSSIPTSEPSEFTQGELLQWTRVFADYPASTYSLTYTLLKSGVEPITITASADGDTFSISVLPAVTAGYGVGIYKWQAAVSRSEGDPPEVVERKIVDSGTMEVLIDYAAQEEGFDTRSHARRTLDYINAMIEGKASADIMNYSISDSFGNSRALGKMTISEILKLKTHYQQLVDNEEMEERIGNGEEPGNIINTRFIS